MYQKISDSLACVFIIIIVIIIIIVSIIIFSI